MSAADDQAAGPRDERDEPGRDVGPRAAGEPDPEAPGAFVDDEDAAEVPEPNEPA